MHTQKYSIVSTRYPHLTAEKHTTSTAKAPKARNRKTSATAQAP